MSATLPAYPGPSPFPWTPTPPKGKLEEAEALLCTAKERRTAELGESHPDTLATLTELAVVMKLLGKVAEAEPLFRAALEGRRELLGDQHPTTLAS